MKILLLLLFCIFCAARQSTHVHHCQTTKRTLYCDNKSVYSNAVYMELCVCVRVCVGHVDEACAINVPYLMSVL